jgi:hypothetical protein
MGRLLPSLAIIDFPRQFRVRIAKQVVFSYSVDEVDEAPKRVTPRGGQEQTTTRNEKARCGFPPGHISSISISSVV